MQINFKNINSLERYKFMSNTVTPRPIAWIVTENEGVVNIAPFSYFVPLSSNPPIVIVSIGQKSDGSPKDTLANILKNKKATICMATKECIEPMTKSATELPKESSEGEEFNIPTQIIKKSYPPIVKGVKIAYFVNLYDTLKLGESKTIPILLQIDEMFVDESIIDEKGYIDAENIGRVGRNYISDYKIIPQ